MFFAWRFAPKCSPRRTSSELHKGTLQGYTTRGTTRGATRVHYRGHFQKYLWVSPPNIIITCVYYQNGCLLLWVGTVRLQVHAGSVLHHPALDGPDVDLCAEPGHVLVLPPDAGAGGSEPAGTRPAEDPQSTPHQHHIFQI